MTVKTVLTIQLLNTFSVRWGDREVTEINKPRLQTLLAYFLLHQGIPISRQQFAFLLWPDTSEQQSRVNLRQLIYRLRSALPVAKDCIHNNGSNLLWNCTIPMWVDVSVFEELAQKTNDSIALQQAVKVYTGDFMPGFYDDWILSERERLNQKYIQVLYHLVNLYEASGNFRLAIETLQRLQTQDPFREETCRRMMTLYAEMGDLRGVRRTYDTFKEQLEQELNLEPSSPTQELYHSLMDIKPVNPSRRIVGQYPLVGREKEWAALLAAWSAGTYDKYRLVLISGEAGIGKTRLAEELLSWSENNGFQRLVTHCYATESLLAYAPIINWLRQMQIPDLEDIWLKEVSRLLPELMIIRPDFEEPGPLTEPWQRQRLFEALRRFLLSGSQPLLFVIEDIQWCDSESLDWLYYLLRADWQLADKDTRRLMVVATLRREELSNNSQLEMVISGLSRSTQIVKIELSSLDLDSSTRLAEEVAGIELNNLQADWVFTESEGNPFFIVEIVRESLRHPGSVLSPQHQDLNPAALSSEIGMPPAVRGLIRSRVNKLSADARDLIELASVIGHIVDTKLLTVVSNRNEDQIISILDELWQARILLEQSNYAYEFSHEKIRETIYSELNPAYRRQLHRRIAETLVKISKGESDRLSGQIAWHYYRSGQPDLAVEYFWRAAQSARHVFGNQDAIEQLQKAIELLPEMADRVAMRNWSIRIHEALGDLYFLTGQNELAYLAFETTLQTISPDEVLLHVRILKKNARTLIRTGKLTEAQLALVRAEMLLKQTDLPEAVSQRELIETRLGFLEFYFWNDNVDQLDAELKRLLPQIEKTDSLDLKLNFYITVSQTSFSWSGFRIREADLVYPRQAMQIALKIGNPELLAEAYYGMGSTLVWFGDFKQSEEYLLQSLNLARQVGNLFLELRCLTYLSFVNRRFGNIETVREYAFASQKIAQVLQRRDFLGVALGNLAWWYWRQDNFGQAESLGRQALEFWSGINAELPFLWVAVWPLMGAYVRLGKIDLAAELIPELINQNQMKVEEDLYPLLLKLQETSLSGKQEKINDIFNQIIKITSGYGDL